MVVYGVYMKKYLLVGLILKDASAIDKITEVERIYFNLDKSLRFDRLLFRVTHFRVLELSSLSLLDISISEYCTGDFDIYGVGKCIRDYYNRLSDDWETIKSIKLNINCLTEDYLDSRYSDWATKTDIDTELKYNNVPVIYDNKPVYGSSLVMLTDCEYGGYNEEVKIYVDYITGETSIYLQGLLVYGKEIKGVKEVADTNKFYRIDSEWTFVERHSSTSLEHMNLLLDFGYTIGDGYISNNEMAVVFSLSDGDIMILPSEVKTVHTLVDGFTYYGITSSIVLPPKAKFKPTAGEFMFSPSDNNNVRLVVSNSMSFEDLKELVGDLGSHTYGLENKNDVVERLEEGCGIKLEFY